jgi:osmotically-inducible protein OsmY
MNNVRAEVANALHWAFAIPRDRVTADVDDGVVTLHGVVERTYQKAYAEAVAGQAPGVTGVKNEICVEDIGALNLYH